MKVKSKSARTVIYLYPGFSYSITKAIVPNSVVIGEKVYKVVSINERAFSRPNLTSVTIGKNVKTIGKNACTYAGALKTVTLKTSNLNKASIAHLLKGLSIKTIKLSGVSKSAQKNYKKWAKFFNVTVK